MLSFNVIWNATMKVPQDVANSIPLLLGMLCISWLLRRELYPHKFAHIFCTSQVVKRRHQQHSGHWGSFQTLHIKRIWRTRKWLVNYCMSIKNWMGPYQRTPKEVARALRYSVLGVCSVGPVGNYLQYDKQIWIYITLYFSHNHGSMENCPTWKETILLEIHPIFSLPWLWEEG